MPGDKYSLWSLEFKCFIHVIPQVSVKVKAKEGLRTIRPMCLPLPGVLCLRNPVAMGNIDTVH